MTIPTELDQQDVMTRNPKIDRTQLEEVRELMEELRESGIEPARYNLEQPFDIRSTRAHPRWSNRE
jgi:D-mannonate dehydratase